MKVILRMWRVKNEDRIICNHYVGTCDYIIGLKSRNFSRVDSMLTVKECNEHIELYEHKIRILKNTQSVDTHEYLLHLERLIKAYETERIAAILRESMKEDIEVPDNKGAYNIYVVRNHEVQYYGSGKSYS